MTDEEMAEEYVKNNNLEWELECNRTSPIGEVIQAFLAGLKAGRTEWHKVADGDLPNKELEEKQLLVRVRNYTEDFILAYYMLDKYYSKNGKRFYFDIDCDTPINTKDIIAWKEIVLPELPKEE